MRAEKDPKTGKWMIQYRYTDWQGKRRKSTKRGFTTKKEAEKWLQEFLQVKALDMNMSFNDFADLYLEDMSHRLREHTMINKKYIIDLKIRPYFGSKKMNEIKAVDIRNWQNELMKQDYSATYLKTINIQLSAIFNYASKYYDLPHNPSRKAGSMGKSRAEEMRYWTKEEFQTFIDTLTNKQQSYMIFNTLYWTGMRIGELLALTKADIDLDERIIHITKSYQRLNGKDVITDPKTPKAKRDISIPDFLAEDYEDYFASIYDLKDDNRLFPVTKYYIEHEMQRGIKSSGVKKIRVHDLRHSHVSMLVAMGFQPLEIADRLGHERVQTTLDTYAHLYPNKRTQMAEKLQEAHKEVE